MENVKGTVFVLTAAIVLFVIVMFDLPKVNAENRSVESDVVDVAEADPLRTMADSASILDPHQTATPSATLSLDSISVPPDTASASVNLSLTTTDAITVSTFALDLDFDPTLVSFESFLPDERAGYFYCNVIENDGVNPDSIACSFANAFGLSGADLPIGTLNWSSGSNLGITPLEIDLRIITDQSGMDLDPVTVVNGAIGIPSLIELSAIRSGDDVELSWSQLPLAVNYEVWRGTTPYFAISDASAQKIADVEPPIDGSLPTHVDNGAASDGSDHYYLVRALSVYNSASSNRVGKVDIPILPGYNMISWPLLPFDTTLQATLGTQLYGTADPQTADRVLVWNPDTQSYASAWFCSGPICEGAGSDFYNRWLAGNYSPSPLQLESDTAFWVHNRSGQQEVVTLLGAVAEASRNVTLGTGYSLVGSAIPIERVLDDLMMPATGTEDPQTADRILYWDAISQSYASAWFCGGPVCESAGDQFFHHWLAGDYSRSPVSIPPGHGFWYHNRHASITWTNPLLEQQ